MANVESFKPNQRCKWTPLEPSLLSLVFCFVFICFFKSRNNFLDVQSLGGADRHIFQFSTRANTVFLWSFKAICFPRLIAKCKQCASCNVWIWWVVINNAMIPTQVVGCTITPDYKNLWWRGYKGNLDHLKEGRKNDDSFQGPSTVASWHAFALLVAA